MSPRKPILLAVLSLLVSGCATGPESPPPPPNIIYILADDLGYGELGCYGQEKIQTPNLDLLARQGMRFTRHYCGAPVCAPSRCVLLTGKHLGHATIRDNKEYGAEGQQPIRADDVTIGQMLRDAGYRTAAIGKWGLGPPGSTGDPNDRGFDLFFGYNCQRVAHSYYPRHLWRNRERVIINQFPVPGHHHPDPVAEINFKSYASETYAPDVMIEEAVQFIQRNRSTPFFLYFAPIEPHVAIQAPKEWVDRYPESWDPTPYRGDRGYLPHARPRAGYAAMISDLDEHVGTILQTLDRLGLTNDTLILFSSDNGPTHARGPRGDVGGADTKFFDSTAGLRGRKGSVYEGGLRVPMIARWPGRIERGSTSDHVSAFYDVMPTLAEVASARLPGGCDGTSFLPALLGKPQPRHDHLLWEFHGYGGQQAVLFGDLKVIRRDFKKGSTTYEVYDLKADPQEATDLAASRPELIERAKKVLAAERSRNPLFQSPELDRRP